LGLLIHPNVLERKGQEKDDPNMIGTHSRAPRIFSFASGREDSESDYKKEGGNNTQCSYFRSIS